MPKQEIMTWSHRLPILSVDGYFAESRWLTKPISCLSESKVKGLVKKYMAEVPITISLSETNSSVVCILGK